MHDIAIDTDRSEPRGRSRLRRSGAIVVVLLTAALLFAACSSGSASPGVASLGKSAASADHSSSSSDPGRAALSSGAGGSGAQMTISGGSGSSASKGLAFSSCMRSHGVPNFPDPNSQGQIDIGSSDGINPQSSQFQSAQQACQKLMPNGGTPSPAQQAQALAAALKFSECMRSHGISDFPDPNAQGGRISLKINASPGSDINPKSPLFQSAQKACAKDIPAFPGGGQSTSGAGAR